MLIVKSCVFFIILNYASAKININIEAGNTSDILVGYSGVEVKVIGDEEKELFNIKEEDLQQAISRLHEGRRPNNVFLKSPTPWGDLYKKYHWEQVSRVLFIKSARVKNNDRQQLLISSQDFENVFNNTIKVNAGITQTVENTVSTSWSTSKEFTFSQEIEYDFNVYFTKMAGKTGISITSNFGETVEKTETLSIGTSSGVEIELKPGQSATAVLTATKGVVEVEVVYQAMLRGNVVVNFKKPYKGHHFYGPSIQKVMKTAGLNNEKLTTQLIRVGFYSDATLKVYDKSSGHPMI